MSKEYKPSQYNSVSPYLVVDGAVKLIEQLKTVFGAEQLRRYDNEQGKIMHAEIRIDDSVVMIADATEQWPAISTVLHVYVKDVDSLYKKAVAAGFTAIDEPRERPGDPDRRGTLRDLAGNFWSVSTQVQSE